MCKLEEKEGYLKILPRDFFVNYVCGLCSGKFSIFPKINILFSLFAKKHCRISLYKIVASIREFKTISGIKFGVFPKG